MRVIGTAGHVDHGKSTLVRSLTGIDPDRLAEEKAREMTIDLGFAWLSLPDGETVGIVDVPGHRDFIENMLAGVGGIDTVLLVIAADEGVMPQTREHLAIIDLLGIGSGLIVLSKTDLVTEPEWLELVEQEIRDSLFDTVLQGAPIVRVSALSGNGLDELKSRLSALVRELPPVVSDRYPRLPIDRVFTISGFGTVVTGTLLGGPLRMGDEIEIQPAGLRARVRGLQSYKQPVDEAQPGSRVAVNLAGVDRSLITRGQVLTHPRQLQPTLLADVRFRQLKDASRPLRHDMPVKLFVGAAEAGAHARLLAAETIEPGEEGWLQLRLDRPLALAPGDRFILRCPSPAETIGGGVVVDPHPGRRWRRFDGRVIERLETRLAGTPLERLVQAASQADGIKSSVLQRQVELSDSDFEAVLDEALNRNLVVRFADSTYLSRQRFEALQRRLFELLNAFHMAEPLRRGIQREQLRSQLGVRQSTFAALLEELPSVVAEGTLVRASDHQVRLDLDQQARVDHLRAQMTTAPYTPPSYAEAVKIVGERLLRALIEQGEIVQVQPDIIFTRDAYDNMLAALLEMLADQGQVTTAEFRDRFGTTRKYAIGFLEHLDAAGITRRIGEARVRGPRA